MGGSPACSGDRFSPLSTARVVSVTRGSAFNARWLFDRAIDTDDADPVVAGLAVNGVPGTYLSQPDDFTLNLTYPAVTVGMPWTANPALTDIVFVPPEPLGAGQSGLVV